MQLERRLKSVARLAFFVGLAASPLAAQIPDKFENLQILPKDISRGDLVGEMREMAGALGVRCNECHVGESPDSLRGYDFATDEKDSKKTARVMMKMVAEINSDLLPKIGKKESELVRVTCVTCHHGQRVPRTLQDVLIETVEKDGIDAAIAKYRELREKYYGGQTFDFREWSLINVAESLTKMDKVEEARRIFELNAELYPDFGMSYLGLGQYYKEKGDKEHALANLRKASELMPDRAAWISKQIEQLNQ